MLAIVGAMPVGFHVGSRWSEFPIVALQLEFAFFLLGPAFRIVFQVFFIPCLADIEAEEPKIGVFLIIASVVDITWSEEFSLG